MPAPLTNVADDAAAFHARNPHVYRMLRQIALSVRKTGRKNFGIAALFERLRWISVFETDDDKYKLNNSYRAFYARLLMEQEPDLAGFFTTRESTFDPEYHDRPKRRPRLRLVEPPAPPAPEGCLF